jgi:hypothetical protein
VSSRAVVSSNTAARDSLILLRRVATTSDWRRWALTLALLIGGDIHFIVGVQHAPSNFGILSFGAGLAQGALAVVVMLHPSRLVYRAALGLCLTLSALYFVNVTVGLPPLIAHSHVPGTHRLWGVMLAWPGPFEGQGLSTQVAQIATIVFAHALGRTSTPKPKTSR